jgi:hypothetical protein
MIHEERLAISYVRSRLRDRDIQMAPTRVQRCRTHPTIDEGFARRTDPPQTTRGRGSWEIVRHVSSGAHRRPTSYAIDLSRCAPLLASLATILEEARQNRTQNEGRLLMIDGGESLLNPAPNGIFVYVQKTSDLLHRVISMDLDEAIIRLPRHWDPRYVWFLPWSPKSPVPTCDPAPFIGGPPFDLEGIGISPDT